MVPGLYDVRLYACVGVKSNESNYFEVSFFSKLKSKIFSPYLSEDGRHSLLGHNSSKVQIFWLLLVFYQRQRHRHSKQLSKWWMPVFEVGAWCSLSKSDIYHFCYSKWKSSNLHLFIFENKIVKLHTNKWISIKLGQTKAKKIHKK